MWHFDRVLLFFMAMLAVLYLFMTGFKPVKRSIYFWLGLMVMFICITSPLHYVGMHYFKLIANNCSIEKIDDNVSFNGSLIQLDIDVNHNNCLEILNHLKRLIVFS